VSLSIADHYEGVETQTASAFDYFSDSAGVDYAFTKTAAVVFSRTLLTVATATSASTATAISTAGAGAVVPISPAGCS
jgi:hypothetical protein